MKKDIFIINKYQQPVIKNEDAKKYISENSFKDFVNEFEKKNYDFPFSKYYMKPFKYYYDNLKKFSIYDNLNYDTKVTAIYGVIFKSSQLIKDLYIFNEPELINQSEKNTVIIELTDDYYYNIDTITNLFTEDSRIYAEACKGIYGKMCLSPKDLWDVNKKDILNNIINNSKLDINTKTLRDTLYKISNEAALFRVTLAKSIYEIFKPKSILDFSSGWGDRLIAALTYDKNIKYYGFDPNTTLFNGYNKIIEKFNTKNVIIKNEPFEKASISHIQNVDLAFTSPPYFNFEIYIDEPTQSINNYKEYDIWLVNFLFVSIVKVFIALKTDGYFVIHITDTKQMNNVCELIMLFIIEFLKGEYVGCIICKTTKTKQVPLWIYKNTKRGISSGQLLKYYPDIYDKVIQKFINKKIKF